MRTVELGEAVVTTNGALNVRFNILPSSGDECLQFHRVSILPGENVAEILAGLNANFSQLGYASISVADSETIKSLVLQIPRIVPQL